ncbi:MAG TPA: PRTRC system protein C [Gemmatimonadaceae bacterium]|nr:PRTRC system protein C [Gemmatimonadaceae bacterium]
MSAATPGISAKAVQRVFIVNGIRHPDPAPERTVEQVADLLSVTYPELVSAAVDGPTVGDDGAMEYRFERSVGTKG